MSGGGSRLRRWWCARTLVVAFLALALVGCGGNGLVRPGSDDEVPADADRMARQLRADADLIAWPQRQIPSDATQRVVSLDTARAATAMIDPAGGEVGVEAADGRTYTLVVPKDALFFPTEITLTPITGVAGLDSAVHGVDIAPHGLQLAAMARLEIGGPDAGPLAAFGYTGAGTELELAVLDPDPERVAVLVEHFSGYGVGPFAAISEALAGSTPPAKAALAEAAAAVHNRRPEADVDRLAAAFVDLVDAVVRLANTATGDCGLYFGASRMGVLAWMSMREQYTMLGGVDVPSAKGMIHELTESLLTCWGEATLRCIIPGPAQLRALEGIRAALIRFNALDTARDRFGKDSLTYLLPCSGSGWIHYRYNSNAGGVSTQITATLELSLIKDPDGSSSMIAGPETRYRLSIISIKGGDCPASEFGQFQVMMGDAGETGAEITPEISLAMGADDDVPSIWFAPIYFSHWADCHDSGSGFDAVALACNEDDPSGGDSLTGSWTDDERRSAYFNCHNQDGTVMTGGVVSLKGSLDWLIRAELWD